MVLTIFISVALISIIPLVITIRGRVSRSASLEQLQERLLDVDLAAFLNLMDETVAAECQCNWCLNEDSA